MTRAGERLINAAKEAKAVVEAGFCKRGWHAWRFVGDGHLIDYGNLIVADGVQRCERCGARRRKAFVVGERTGEGE